MTYKEDGDEIIVLLPCGTKTVIDKLDVGLLSIFPVWVERGRYTSIERSIETPYGNLRQHIYLHRAIMIDIFGFQMMTRWKIDHKDRDRFNNRRSNLRLATAWQNAANSKRASRSNAGFRGVHQTFRGLIKQFNAHIGAAGGKRKNLGHFLTAEDAARAYDAAAKERYGSFALLNFPEDL